MEVIVYGSQLFGRLVRELLPATGHRFIGFVDDEHAGEDVLGDWEEVLGRFSPDECGLVVAVGYRSLAARRRIGEKVREASLHRPGPDRLTRFIDTLPDPAELIVEGMS